MSKYRLMNRRDRIQQGDQALADEAETWGDLSGWEIGCYYPEDVFVPMRRPIANEEHQKQKAFGIRSCTTSRKHLLSAEHG